jgi:hypothetical protein
MLWRVREGQALTERIALSVASINPFPWLPANPLTAAQWRASKTKPFTKLGFGACLSIFGSLPRYFWGWERPAYILCESRASKTADPASG